MTSERILVVDDEESIRSLLQEYFIDIGCDVETACNGADALKKFRPGLFDCIISDLSMPIIDGLELLKKIRLQDSDVVFLVMTGYPKVESAIDAIKEGAYDYIAKPLDMDDLRLKIQRALSLRKTEKSLKKVKGLFLTMVILVPILISIGIIVGIYWQGLK